MVDNLASIPAPRPAHQPSAVSWRWATGLLAGVTLLLGSLLLSWGAGLCLDSYTSTRVLPDGRTLGHVVCLHRATAWPVVALGVVAMAGGLLAAGAVLLARQRRMAAGAAAFAAGVLALPVGGMSTSLTLFTVPVALMMLGVSPLLSRTEPKAAPTVAAEPAWPEGANAPRSAALATSVEASQERPLAISAPETAQPLEGTATSQETPPALSDDERPQGEARPDRS